MAKDVSVVLRLCNLGRLGAPIGLLVEATVLSTCARAQINLGKKMIVRCVDLL